MKTNGCLHINNPDFFSCQQYLFQPVVYKPPVTQWLKNYCAFLKGSVLQDKTLSSSIGKSLQSQF